MVSDGYGLKSEECIVVRCLFCLAVCQPKQSWWLVMSSMVALIACRMDVMNPRIRAARNLSFVSCVFLLSQCGSQIIISRICCG